MPDVPNALPAADAAPRPRSFGRRAFLAGAGSLLGAFAAPLVVGQRIPGAGPEEEDPLAPLAAEPAYAEDAGTFEFDVAKPSEVVIKVIDLWGNSRSAVKGATVKLKSLDVEDAPEVALTTGDDGTAKADIKALCDPKRAKNGIEYLCDLAITVRAAGCRQVNIESRQVIGGTGFILPTCSIPKSEEDIPYLRSVSFNGRDCQYSTYTFMYSAGNSARQEISASAVVKGDAAATVNFWRWRPTSDTWPGLYDRSVTMLATWDASISEAKAEEYRKLDAKDEAAMAEGREYDAEAYEDRWVRDVVSKERYLQTAFDRAFQRGDRLVVSVRGGGFEFVYLMSTQFAKAPLSEVYSSTSDGLPGINSLGLSVNLPKQWPVVGGSKFSIWTPTIPLVLDINPIGHLIAGFTFFSAEGEADQKNPFSKDNWEKCEAESFKAQCKSFQEQFKKRTDGYKSMYQNWKNPQNGNKTKRMQYKMFSKFEASVAAQAYAQLTWDAYDMYYDAASVWTGSLNAVVGLAGEGNISFMVLLGPVPLFLNLNPSADLSLSLRAGLTTSLPGDDRPLGERVLQMIEETNISWADNQVAFVLNVGFSVTAGVGVAGVASIGVRGSAGITCYVALWDGSGHDAEGSYTWPHARVGAGIDLAVAAQIWLFKYSKKIASLEWPTLYDSWGIDAQAMALGDDEPEARPTATGMPAAFALGGAAAQANDEVEYTEMDEDGNYTISFEELAKNAQPVTEDELQDTAEFRASAAAVAAFADEGEALDLVATEVAAGEVEDENGEMLQTMLGYSLKLVSEDEAAGVATLADDGVDGALDPDDPTSGAEFREQPDLDPDDFEEVEGKRTDAELDGEAASVSGIAEAGGVTPSIDTAILEDVFSDGRPRMATIGTGDNKKEVMLRIATGTYGGQARSRLVVQVRENNFFYGWRWSRALPVEFNVEGLGGIKRADLYDYDFDVCECEGYLVIMLLSGTRSEGTTFLSACTSSVTTILTLGKKPNDRLGVFWAKSWMSFDHGSSYGDGEELYLAYSPCIMCARTDSYIRPKEFSTYYISGGFIYKRAKGGAVLSSDTPAHAAGFVFRTTTIKDISSYSVWGTTENQTFDMDQVPTSVTSLTSAGGSAWIQSSRPAGERAEFCVAYESADGSGFFPIDVRYIYSGPTGQHELHVLWRTAIRIAGAKKVYPWLGGETSFLAIDERGVLCKVDAYNHLIPISPYREQVDNEGRQQTVCEIPPDFSLTPDGSMLVFAENKEGIDGFDYDGAGQDGEPTATTTDGRYRLMASRAVTYTAGYESVTLFTKPFPLCELPHAVDQVTSVTTSGSTIRIVASTITSLIDSKSNYYEIKVPVVACATATSMVAPTSTLVPGDEIEFEVTLRNDGNTRLQSATLTLCDENGGALASPQKIDFGPDTVVFNSGAKANEDDPMADPVFDSGYHNDGGLDADAFAGHPLVVNGGRNCLIPGDTATIKAPFTVPIDWQGTKKLRVDVSGFTFASPASGEARAVTLDAGAAGVTAECEAAGIAGVSGFTVDEDHFVDKRTLELTVGESGEADASGMSALAVEPLKEGEVPDPDPENPDPDPDPNPDSDKDKDKDKDNGDDNGGGNNNGGDKGTGNGKKKSRVPDTGDPSVLGGAAGALMGIGGLAMAGLAAYSRRRAENEAQEGEGSEEE